jgi:alcohol dehydrogenase class IV
MAIDFSFYSPTRIILKRGSINSLCGYLLEFSPKRVLLVTGQNSLRSSGLLEGITKSLLEKNVLVFNFEGVKSDPDTAAVDKCLSFAKKNSCDMVVGIGGGSVIDCAKAVAGLFNEKGFKSSADYLEVDGTKNISSRGLPFVSVPTISGTGAEVTRNAVITNTAKKTKRSIRHDFMYPALCLVDPELALAASFEVSRASAIDALCHLLEGYMSRKSAPFSDMLALEGMEFILSSISNLKNNLKDYGTRESIAYASLLGGLVLSNSGLTLSHGIGSVIGPRYGISHGVSCAICLPGTIELNLPALNKDKQDKLKKLFGGDVAAKVRNILKFLEIPGQLSCFGITEMDINKLAGESLDTSSARGNPKDLCAADVADLMKKCI